MVRRILALLLLSGWVFSTAQAATVADVEQALSDARQLRALEFAPGHLTRALGLLDQARHDQSLDSPAAAEALLARALQEARGAGEVAQRFSETFAPLVESRDRLQLAGERYVRKDLAERAEREFAQVVSSFEQGKVARAKRQARIAERTFHAAQVVAARERFVRPVSLALADARRVNAIAYAPNAMKAATDARHKLERLIKENPDAEAKAHALSHRGREAAARATRIAKLGKQFAHKPASIERWVDEEQARNAMLGKALGVRLSAAQTPEAQQEILRQAVEDMKAGYAAQLADAEAQIQALNAKLEKYDSELVGMAEIRRKLQLRREAEAKIKRLAGLFDPEQVEVLLTPEADVILRMKAVNFRSGSAVIPPSAYAMLDAALQAIGIFSERSVRVEGHTDSVGSSQFNQTLSERRANAVRDYLLQQLSGGEHPMVTAVGFGEDRPIANNETAEGRKKNRRIDIVLLAPRG